jgi:hypothetical protein
LLVLVIATVAADAIIDKQDNEHITVIKPRIDEIILFFIIDFLSAQNELSVTALRCLILFSISADGGQLIVFSGL